MLTVAYFCIATEIRFLEISKNNSTIIPTMTCLQSIDKSELWHSKAVEFSCLYYLVFSPYIHSSLESRYMYIVNFFGKFYI